MLSATPSAGTKRRKKILVKRQHPLVTQLRHYARAFTPFAVPLLECANEIDKLSTGDEVEARALIVKAITQHGCRTIGDIVDETRLAEAQVKRICRELVEDKEFEIRPIGPKLVAGSGGGARPKGMFRIDEPAGNRLVSSSRRSNYENEFDTDDDE